MPIRPSRNTPGVERILKLACKLAMRSAAANVEPLHLLWALVLEESRGSEILHQHGITWEELPEELATEPDTEASPDSDMAELPLSEALNQVLNTAELHSGRQGRYAELGSEHLLIGLTAVSSGALETLQSHGLTAERLQSLLDEAEGNPDTPLAVDFELADKNATATDETDLFRILDAAANRVREGVRVLEDYVRFGRDDRHLTSLLKTWRHDLRAVLGEIDDRRLLSSRDTAADVGTGLNTPGERRRQSLHDVLRANCKRVQEGLRTLEEYGKILSPNIGEAFSQLRYRFYTLEKILAVNAESRRKLADRNLYVLVTRDQCRLDPLATIRIALNAGADMIQIREKSLSDREVVEYGKQVREWTWETNALLIMNDRPDLAVLIEADGVHVGQEELSVREARRILGPDRIIGVSTHSLEQAEQAVDDGADYLGVGPVFPSRTKTFSESELAGLEFVRQVAEAITLPWFAIGGITPENLVDLKTAGATRIAVSHAVCGSESPGEIVTKLKEAIDLKPSAERQG